MFYFKLPYIGYFSPITQKKIHHFIKHYGKDLDIKLVFSSFKIGNLFGAKDLIPDRLHSRVVCLYVPAVMPVLSAKRAGIFPHVLESS